MSAYGMLVTQALGDAYGAAYESIPDVKGINDLTYRKHPKWNIGNGRYTDDTQMTLGLVEFLIYANSKTPGILADYFVHAYKRDPRPGYMRGFRQLLEEIQDGNELLNRIHPFSRRS